VRVRRYAVELASALGMSEEEAKKVSYAGLLHDIGKIGMREDILLKPGELTPEEFEEVKLHSVLGG
jgi:HD-GYP domain-containing protein (c-di-GMP phosphodiesterase class II)